MAKIKEAIAHYGLSQSDLFGRVVTRGPRASLPAGRRTNAGKKPAAAKYTDGNGRTWSGRGKRPNWFKDALAAGKSSKDLEIGAGKA